MKKTMQEYNNTDRQLHWLSQLIAKVNKAFVTEKTDDSHTNLYYDPVGDKLTGRWIESPQGEILFSLNLETMQFEWLDKTLKSQQAFTIFDKSIQQLEKDAANYPAKFGMEADAVFKPLHFTIPDYGIKSISEKDISEEGFAAWKFYRQLANEVCHALPGYLQVEGEVRIWPHHFDTGIYAQLTDNLSIGFGLAMKDDMAGNAYFYLSAYKSSGSINYVDLPELSRGQWETGAWKGAILRLDEIPVDSIEQAGKIVINFFKGAVRWLLNQNN
ncbi:MAG: hypothetical protein RQ761_03670 [Bacteroidales bacterium]|nr:hypothetical protein [Bacteroidales bacterium]